MTTQPTSIPDPEFIGSSGKRGKLLYRWDNPPARTSESDDTPEAYIVQELHGYGGCLIWGRYGNRWEPNANPRALVLHLMGLAGIQPSQPHSPTDQG